MSARLIVHRSNRTEVLVDRLADVLAKPVGGPFDAEWVVVQGRGMALWLAQALSQRLGIWAGDTFLYPRNFVSAVAEAVRPTERDDRSPFERDCLAWAIADVLDDSDDEAFAALRRYGAMGDDPDDRSPAVHRTVGVRSMQLAQRIADVFDGYLTYRPDLLLAWEEGIDRDADDVPWQPALWRALVARHGSDHPARLEQDVLPRLLRGEANGAEALGLAPRIAVFGLVSLPPSYLRVLTACARHAEVHWFLPSPTRGYWANLVPPRVLAEARRQGVDVDAQHLDGGHPMLASLGRLGADLQNQLQEESERLGIPLDERDHFVEPEGDHLLARLHGTLLDLVPRDEAPVGPPDDSVRLLACHSPLREVEALHDHLLGRFDADPSLSPHDVVVMMADVETYAPVVEAVFGRDPDDRLYIPHRIADRAVRGESPVVDAYLRLLDLVGSRMRATEVLDLLGLTPVRQRFGISQDELDQVQSWVVESGIRWGVDAAHREAEGQPADERNTWRFGLERLLLGYAMPTLGRATFAGRLPYDEVEGSDAALVGKLGLACEELFAISAGALEPRSMEAWAPVLVDALDRMVHLDDDTAWEHQRLRDAIALLVEEARAARTEITFGLDAVAPLLEARVDGSIPARGFLAGGVTFCAMVPMRSIPFRVVCLLGMDDGAFPRMSRPADFDLMARKPRRGDRDRRDDDRYLFLEAVTSARDQLVIGYRGRSIRDDAPLAPAPVVEELGRAIDDVLDEPALPALTTHLPLHPFDPKLFAATAPQSFEATYAEAAAAVGAPRTPPPSLFTTALEAPTIDRVELADVVGFFENPVRHLFERRLGVRLQDVAAEVRDREPVELVGLDHYQLGDRLLGLRLDGVEPEALLELAQGTGALPIGAAGRCDHRELLRLVDPIAEHVSALRDGERARDATIALSLPSGVELRGAVGDRWGRHAVRHQFATVTGKHLLSTWIRHLAACAAGEEVASFLVGRAKRPDGTAPSKSRHPVHTYALAPLSRGDATARLDRLLELYRVGASEPLLLFPRAGYALAASKRPDDGGVPRTIRRLWRNQERGYDPYLRRAFPDASVLDPDAQPFGYPRRGPSFVELVDEVFVPLREHVEVDG